MKTQKRRRSQNLPPCWGSPRLGYATALTLPFRSQSTDQTQGRGLQVSRNRVGELQLFPQFSDRAGRIATLGHHPRGDLLALRIDSVVLASTPAQVRLRVHASSGERVDVGCHKRKNPEAYERDRRRQVCFYDNFSTRRFHMSSTRVTIAVR